ncbi:hypothetical protein ACIQI8_27205 [Streptomyces sp. NPDC092369]|uniref:hypothetical protein n=1 Tax=Streptomyces sp. NPDC092369 TaxID=3366015 RepID=UPI00382080F7
MAVDALLDAYAARGRALQRVLGLVARHADQVAAEPSLVLRALDAHPTAIGWCPPACAGDCTPDKAVMAHPAANTSEAPDRIFEGGT